MRIPDKRYQTNMVCTFLRYLECLSFEVLRFGPFRQVPHKNLQNTSVSKPLQALLCLLCSFLDSISLYGWKDSHGSQRSLYCTTSRSDNFQLVQWWFVTHRKKIEEVHLVDEEFLHNKVKSNGFYMWIMVCYRIYLRRWMYLRQLELRIMEI